MKKLLFSMTVMALLCPSLCSQHLHRVNNNAAADVAFTTLQAALDAAADGDTIYIEGSSVTYEGAIISKKLTLIGPGYFLNENPETQACKLEATFNSTITFDSGSEESTMMGITMARYVNLMISTGNITLIRNYLEGVDFNATSDNILIAQNYCNSGINGKYGTISNMIIANNIINGSVQTASGSGPIIVSNNILTNTDGRNSISCYNASIQNNIVTRDDCQIFAFSGNTINNNLLAREGSNANGNLYNVDMSAVFADFDYLLDMSTDGRWKLKENSPASGAGVGETDCGVFAGLTPYILSGIPNLPHIYEASIQAAASEESGLQVSIRVKSGDE